MRATTKSLWAIALLTLSVSSVSAAAPHLMIVKGGTLDHPLHMESWNDNHVVMQSLGDVVSEEIAGEYFDLTLYWGPERIEQKGRLYMAQGSTPPILVLDGQPPRYVGSEGIRIFAQYGVVLVESDSRRLILISILVVGLVVVGVSVVRLRGKRSRDAI